MTDNAKLILLNSGAKGLEELLSYRLSRVGNLLSRSQFMRLRNLSELTQQEWRLLVLVFHYGPLPVKTLARHAGLDFGQVSRLAARMHGSGLIARSGASDGRSVVLSLTPKGRALHRKLWAQAMTCNDTYLESLSGTQCEVLLQAFETLEAAARSSIQATEQGESVASRRA